MERQPLLSFELGEHDQLLAAGRQQWRTGDALDDYRQHRPMVERSLAGSSPTATVESVAAASNANA